VTRVNIILSSDEKWSWLAVTSENDDFQFFGHYTGFTGAKLTLGLHSAIK